MAFITNKKVLLSFLYLLEVATNVLALDCASAGKPTCQSADDCVDLNNILGLNSACGSVECVTSTGTCTFEAWSESGTCATTNFFECAGDHTKCTKGPSGVNYEGTCTGYGNNECIYTWCPGDLIGPTNAPPTTSAPPPTTSPPPPTPTSPPPPPPPTTSPPSGTTALPLPLATPSLEAMVVNNVGGTAWTTVPLSNTYSAPVPVCSVDNGAGSSNPVLVRMQEVGPTSFKIRLQNPGDKSAVAAKAVNCLVVEQGKWKMPDGRLVEAMAYTSTVTDHKNSWKGEIQIYGNTYQNPVVVGQVMTSNDPKWSVFWSSNPSSSKNPPSASGIVTGKHVGEDTIQSRADETIGIIVMEAGHDSSQSYEAGLGQDTVRGAGNSASGYSYTFATAFPSPPAVRIVSQAGMDGGDGGFAVLAGDPTESTIKLVIEEDQIADAERSHTTEQVAYIVFEQAGSIGLTPTTTVAPPSPPPPSATPPPIVQEPIIVDGSLDEWSLLHRMYPKIWELQTNEPNFEIWGKHDKNTSTYFFALKRTDGKVIGTSSTIYLDTDQSSSSRTTHGLTESEFYLECVNDAAGNPIFQLFFPSNFTLVGDVEHAFSADKTVVEIAIPASMIGGETVGDVDFFVDVNDSKFFPMFFGLPWFTATYFDLPARTADPISKRVGIVFSPESEQKLYGGGEINEYIYCQLYASVQHQTMMAGIPYDLIYFDDLKDLQKIVNYNALVFPYNAYVPENDRNLVARNLRLAVHFYGIGVIAADNFMTDAVGGTSFPDPYRTMWEVLGLTIDGYGSGNLTITVTNADHPATTGYAPGESVLEYPVGWFNHYGTMAAPGVFETSSTITVLAKTTTPSASHNALLAVETMSGARHVHLATLTMIGDGNLMWKALRWVVFGNTSPVGLQISRQKSVFSARNDMDQSMFPEDVETITRPLYQNYLVPWKQQYNFVGSYFVNIGDKPNQGEYTDWAVSGPLYQQYIALGNEIGSHSYNHPNDINTLTEAQLAYEFGGSGQIISQQLSLDPSKLGYAQPGNPENLRTVKLLDAMSLYYLSGTYTGKGIGFPSTFGYLYPDANMGFIAPNMFSDFNLLGWKALTQAQALTVWTGQYQELQHHANTAIIHYHWHDYAPFDWSPSLFENTIAMAYNGGSEFIVSEDLVKRIEVLKGHELRVSESAGVVTASVFAGSSRFGRLALDAGCEGSEVIESVDNWYAYNDKKIFLPQSGGTFVIRKGFSQNINKTRIVSLPMRADLTNVVGDGTVLEFTFNGSGTIVVELNAQQAGQLVGSGATKIVQVGQTTLEMTFDSVGLNTGSIALT